VTIIVPFGGDAASAEEVVQALAKVSYRASDEVVVVDNGLHAAIWPANREEAGIKVVRAAKELSSYYARNAGVEASSCEWILFLDSDCKPSPTILDDFFHAQPGDRVGVVAGRVIAAPQTGLIPAYAASRGHISEEFHLTTGPYPAGVTANLLVRRTAWEGVGGFFEGVKSGADVEFCWRVQSAGWGFEHAPHAEVAHSHPERLPALLRKARRHAAGRFWVDRRWDRVFGRPRIARPLVRSMGGSLVWLIRGQPKRALFKLIDGAWAAANFWGYLVGDNRAPRGPESDPPADAARLALLTDAFPAKSETFVTNEVDELARTGWTIQVESSSRPARTDLDAARRLRPNYLEDERVLEKLSAAAWLFSRHPVRCAWDLAQRGRWSREEHVWRLASIAPLIRRLARSDIRHLHVHFAAGAALHAMRASRMLGIEYSLTAHAYDIFKSPRNLSEKIERAALVFTGSEYNVRYLRGLVSPPAQQRIHRLHVGIDPDEFSRRTPYPERAVIGAVGRLVPKKGFADLVVAAGILRDQGAEFQVRICGDGPERERLSARISDLGLESHVQIVEGWGTSAVRGFLEGVAVFAMPSVIDADGDRDGIPTVVKEALAMGIPVVGSAESGLPEVVHADWGRLAPPSNPEALAARLNELLELPVAERKEMGGRGRRFVLENFRLETETARLARRIEAFLSPGQG
jgi:colanic acid/amylovoran biosynthesis glycosyltransferase